MSKTEMRKVMTEELEKLLLSDESVVIMDADLASANGTMSLHQKYPDRVINVGISEANMVSMAAGMAAYGMKPFIITFTPFATRRVADQLAISCAYAKQNVKVIGTDSGVTAQNNGGTHMSLEDIGIVRSIPTTQIYEPTDALQFKQALPIIKDLPGFMYIRTVRKESIDVFEEGYQFDLFKADLISEGKDLSIITSGICVHEAIEAKKELEMSGIHPEILSIHTIKPIDEEAIIRTAKKTGKVLVVENHNIYGGLFSSVCEVLSTKCPTPTHVLAIKDHFGEVGKTQFLMDKYQISAKYIVEEATKMCSTK